MLILASKSPRRSQLLTSAGFTFLQVESPFVDPADPGRQSTGTVVNGLVGARNLAGQLALKKAQALISSNLLEGVDDPIVIGADTICVDHTGSLIGTPSDEAQARDMLMGFEGHAHWVVSACCVIRPGGEPLLIVDEAKVTVGEIEPDRIASYLASGKWQGKAGGYNLSERVMDGWPINVEGDPDTVTGLPVKLLVQALAQQFRIYPSPH